MSNEQSSTVAVSDVLYSAKCNGLVVSFSVVDESLLCQVRTDKYIFFSTKIVLECKLDKLRCSLSVFKSDIPITNTNI